VNLEVTEFQASSGAVVQVEDDALGSIASLDVIPAWLGDAGAISPVRTKVTLKVLECQVCDTGAGLVLVIWTRTLVLIVIAGTDYINK
jgi:hypothetical protein